MDKNDVKILVTDDEIDIQELIKFQLEMEGYQVVTASSGSEGYQTFQDQNVHVIVSDVRMPNGDGIEFLDKVVATTDPPYFYFMTGFADITKEECLKKGASGFFSKPFNLEEFTSEINNCIENKVLK